MGLKPHNVKVHSKTRTTVQLGILLGLSGDSGDGMGVGGAVLCINLANQMQEET